MPIGYAPGGCLRGLSILRRLFLDVIEDKNRLRPLVYVQLQPELLLNRVDKGNGARWVRRLSGRTSGRAGELRKSRIKTRHGVVVEGEVPRAADTGAIQHWVVDIEVVRLDLLRELRHGHVLANQPDHKCPALTEWALLLLILARTSGPVRSIGFGQFRLYRYQRVGIHG